jgi:subtilase family serine protease
MRFLGVRPVRGTTTRFVQMTLATGAVISIAAIAAPGALAAAPRARVAESARAQLPALTHIGARLAATRRIPLTITMQPRDALALKAFATAVSTPGSAQYGQYLSVPQFAHRFGASGDAVEKVEHTLRAGGLRVRSVSANQLSVKVSGTVGQIENVFRTQMAQVRLPAGRRAFANTTAATLPVAAAADVQGVIGLDSVAQDESQIAKLPKRPRGSQAPAPDLLPDSAPRATGGPTPCSTAVTTEEMDATAQGVPLTANFVATAYSVPPLYAAGDLGAGQTVALFEEDQPYPQTDVAQFLACYGIATSVTQVPIDGGPGAYTPGTSDDGEVTLDIDNVADIAPGANILVYDSGPQATAGVDLFTAIISQDQAKVVSNSFGICEALETPSTIQAENTLLQEAAAQGQSVFSSSGDAGDAMCSQHSTTNTGLSVIDPAAQPFNTAVGGTFVHTTLGPPPGESVWNDGGGGSNGHGGISSSASGGGLSTEWAMPSYQSTASPNLGVINASSIVPGISCGATDCREVPDVSANASPDSGYVVFSNGQFTVTGGTSGSAPTWAALAALWNASPACRGLSLGFVNPSLYSIAGTSYLTDFNDVTTNDPDGGGLVGNDVFGQGFPYPTTVNYDMTTGIGTPVASALGAALCAARAPVFTVTVANPGTVTATAGKPFALQITGADSGSAALSYAASGLPAGLVISPTTGVISGTPTTVGNAAVTVSATDAFTNAGSVPFALDVVKPKIKKAKPLTASKITLAGLAKRKPALTFAIGGGKTALKAFSISLPSGLAFSKKAKSLDKGVKVKAGKKAVAFTATVKRGALSITLKKTAKAVTVTISKPALTITRSEAKKIKRKKVKTLALTIKTTNAKKKTHTTKVTLKKFK